MQSVCVYEADTYSCVLVHKLLFWLDPFVMLGSVCPRYNVPRYHMDSVITRSIMDPEIVSSR